MTVYQSKVNVHSVKDTISFFFVAEYNSVCMCVICLLFIHLLRATKADHIIEHKGPVDLR